MDIKKKILATLGIAGLAVGAYAVGALTLGSAFAQSPPPQNSPTTVQEQREDERDADVPITGNALDSASAAALKYLGEGRVTDTEVGDEEGYYEVEVTLANGSQVDVHLDENFNVLGTEADSDKVED